MKIKSISFLGFLAVAIMSSPAFSQEAIDISKIPTINNKDWRTPSTFRPPWSTPVLVNDDFDGTYIAVFDHNFQVDGGFMGMGGTGEHGFTTNWSPKMVRAYYYTTTSGGTTIRETSSLMVKVGNQTFKLPGDKGNFAVSSELAYALKTAPLEVARIKAEFADSGIPYTSDIGTGTVTAWRTVYQQAKDPSLAVNSSKVIKSEVVNVGSSKAKTKAKTKRKH
jgi:hypothetical protein